MPDQKSKLKVFEQILALVGLLSERNAQHQHSVHHSQKMKMKSKQKLKLNFFHKAILDDIAIILSMIRINSCGCSHVGQGTLPPPTNTKQPAASKVFAEKFIDMCCRSIQRIQEKNSTENERAIPFFNIFGKT